MRVILSSLLALALAAPAVSQPTSPTVDQAYADALAATATPLSLKRDQSDWLEGRARDETAEDRAANDMNRVEFLLYMAGRDRRGAADRLSPAELSERCADFELMGCHVAMGGFLNDPNANRRLYWQVQNGADPFNGIRGGLVLMTEEGGRLRPAAWTFEGATASAPIVVEADEDATLIVVNGIHAGSGGGRADVVFRWAPDGALVQVDNWSWRDGLDARLPEGREVWQGVEINYETMVALTPLWRESDGNCCSSGGLAVLFFRLEDDRIVLENVRATVAG